MPSLLNDMPHERADRLFKHPMTQDVYGWVKELIVDLRQCGSYKDYVDFQQNLLTKILAAQQHWDGTRRVVKRLRQGKSVPADAVDLASGEDPADPESWALEAAVCERSDRHLRSIGDALAWTVFNYDQRVVVALSRNQEPGPSVGKEGLAAERDFVARWSAEDGCFVLLHAVTSCLRIADATLFRSVGQHFEAELHEIKTNPTKKSAAQRYRQRMAEEAIRDGGPLPGDWPARFITLSVPYKTHLRMLQDAFQLAAHRGVQGMKVPGGRALIAAYLPRGYELWDEQEFLERTGDENARALKRAGILNRGENVWWGSDDEVARSAIHPPWAIYPLAPDLCASLIADMAVYVVTMSSEPLLQALADAGLEAEWVLPHGQPQLQPGQAILRARIGSKGIEMRPSELQRLLLELADLPIWVAGVKEVLEQQEFGTLPWPCFAAEHKVWA
jgi:hypothetical protein